MPYDWLLIRGRAIINVNQLATQEKLLINNMQDFTVNYDYPHTVGQSNILKSPIESIVILFFESVVYRICDAFFCESYHKLSDKFIVTHLLKGCLHAVLCFDVWKPLNACPRPVDCIVNLVKFMLQVVKYKHHMILLGPKIVRCCKQRIVPLNSLYDTQKRFLQNYSQN